MAERRAARLAGPGRLREERGIALAIAVFALVVLAAVVAGGYYSASQEFQIGRSMKTVTASFYAAEAGIQRLIQLWEPKDYNAMLPGDTAVLGPVVLEGGASFSALAVRVDDDSNPLKRYFYIESVGRPPGGLGERRQAASVRTRFHDQICCDAAATVLEGVDTVTNASDPLFSGLDQPPAVWPPSACAAFPLTDVAGIIAIHADSVHLPGTDIQGSPRVLINPALTMAAITTYDDVTYADLAQWSDHQFGDGASPSLDPSLDANGECDKSDPNNWGAPTDPSHPCFDYFPVIYASGVINLGGNRSVQGILIADDDVRISGPFTFYGIIIARDDLELSGRADVYGGALVGDDITINGNKPRVLYSNCAIKRAVRLSSLAAGKLLARRAWVEIIR